MATYSVFFNKSVEKDLKSLPQKDLKRILEKIELLSIDPRPFGSEKLSGVDNYRLRQGRYRIVYSIKDQELTVWIIKVAHRKDVYR